MEVRPLASYQSMMESLLKWALRYPPT
jgi:hypothetical protein